jgi:hypothetical protein
MTMPLSLRLPVGPGGPTRETLKAGATGCTVDSEVAKLPSIAALEEQVGRAPCQAFRCT